MNTPPPFHPHGMPPVPRDHDKASLTEVLPFGSRKIRMTRSPITIFLLMCAVATPLLFSFLIGSFEKYDLVGEQALIQGFIRTSVTAIFLMTVAYCLAIYFYARPGRSIWPFLMAYVFLALIAIVPEVFGFNFIWDAFAYIFRDAVGITVERLQRPDAGFFDQFSGMFVAAGLCEELFKMLPVLFGAALAIAYQRRPGPRSGFVRFFQIRGPLDGALMGVFTGAAFVFWETAFQYVPGKADEIAQLTGDTGTGMYMGFMLLFPRVIGGIVGHSAYSAIFGYFIGLGVLRRRHFIPLFLGGWLTASLIHGLWNSVSAISPNLWYAVAIVSAIFAAAVILKGRQLNQAMGGGDAETMGSILIDRSGTGCGG
jgi:RsiW-degrading membrane proteinase PrsW (M82 family)